MAESDLLVRVLQACSQSAPAPLFPAEFAASTGVERRQLDETIDRLRLNGYIQIADWVQGKGQGYTLTQAGAEALTKPTELRQPATVPEPTPERSLNTRNWERGEVIRAALVEPAPPVVTMVLLFVNLLAFAIGLGWALLRDIPFDDYLGGKASGELGRLAALSTSQVIVADEWWRLVTHQFLHGGLLHLGVNMFALYNLGSLLEALWGSRRFLPLYLVSGIIGGAAVLMTGKDAVGASGAICGLLGSFAVWLWLNRDCMPDQVTASWRSSIIINLFLMAAISTIPRVSWEGHLGGVIGGALFSIPLHFQRFGVPWQRLVSWLGFLVIPAAAIAMGYYIQARKPDDLTKVWLHDQFIERYAKPVNATETFLLARRNQFIVPVFHDRADDWTNDAQKVADLRKACDESLAKLGQLREDLAAFEPSEETAAQEARTIRAYFDAWHELFESFQRHLQRPEAWNPARRAALEQKDTAVFHVRKPLEKNVVLPQFPELVPAKERPAPAKAPRNMA